MQCIEFISFDKGSHYFWANDFSGAGEMLRGAQAPLKRGVAAPLL